MSHEGLNFGNWDVKVLEFLYGGCVDDHPGACC